MTGIAETKGSIPSGGLQLPSTARPGVSPTERRITLWGDCLTATPLIRSWPPHSSQGHIPPILPVVGVWPSGFSEVLPPFLLLLYPLLSPFCSSSGAHWIASCLAPCRVLWARRRPFFFGIWLVAGRRGRQGVALLSGILPAPFLEMDSCPLLLWAGLPSAWAPLGRSSLDVGVTTHGLPRPRV